MSRNGSGTYTNPYPNFVSGTVISSSEVDNNNSDIATALTKSIAVDGQSTITADIPFAGFSPTGIGALTVTGDVTGLTINATGDTAAADNAAVGYTAGEGLILTGQGSTNDVTIKNDADGEVMGVLTGTTTAAFTGQVTATGFTGTLDGVLGSGTAAAVSATTIGATGLITAAAKLDLNGTELILDADADTSITADTDDQIDIRIAGADDFQFTANTFTALSGSGIVQTDQNLFLGDTACSSSSRGVVINHGAADDDALVLKSSDVAHGMGSTSPYGNKETDTYFSIEKQGATTGGAALIAFAEDAATSGRVLRLVGYGGTASTAKSTAGFGTVDVHSGEHNGSGGRASFAANSNLFSVSANDTDGNQSVQFIVDLEGDIHYNGSDAGAYDNYEDAQLTRALDLSHNIDTIDSKFDKFVSYNHENLAELGLVGREEDGSPNHFINLTGLQRLHNGAIWQQYEKHENLLSAVYELAVAAVGEDKANEILANNEIKLLSKNEVLN